MVHSDFVYWFHDVDKEDVALVGYKGANLAEMTQAGFPVPNGFIITTRAYFTFIRENNLSTKIKHLLAITNFNHPDSLHQVSQHIKKLVMEAQLSERLLKEIRDSYTKLSGLFTDSYVTIRSSIPAEDTQNLTFPVQQEMYVDVKGDTNVFLKIQTGWASLFEPQAISYRHEHHIDHFRIGIAIIVQEMVPSEKSGVMFTSDPVTNDKARMIIKAMYGAAYMITKGHGTPDKYEVNKADLVILKKNILTQDVYIKRVESEYKEVRLSPKEGSKQKLTDKQIKELAALGKKLETYCYFPQEVEWTIHADTIYIIKNHPITTCTIQKDTLQNNAVRDSSQHALLTGIPAFPGIASGPVRIITSSSEINKIERGDVLDVLQTHADFIPAMKKASAIIIEKGTKLSHAAIVFQELGIPAVIDAKHATTILKNWSVVTVNGNVGNVSMGGYIQAKHTSMHKSIEVKKTMTKIFVNVAEPLLAEMIAKKNVDGIAVLEPEYILKEIGVHPKKMIRDGRKHEYITYLASKIEIFCKAFAPRPVIYQASNFTTNAYRGLIGGKDFEQEELSPLLGYRGAFRHIHDPEVFELELEAIKVVRNKKGYKNLWMTVPFVRSVRELIDIKRIIFSAGLYRSSTFKLSMMVEIPSNVMLLDEFIQIGIDGVCIGLNNLTMLMLGTDQNNSEVAQVYDEQNGAVLWAVEKIIKTAKKHRVSASIIGNAPSFYPGMLEKLVKWGITSISVSPDMIDSVRVNISQIEERI